jgi:hypothetical protein
MLCSHEPSGSVRPRARARLVAAVVAIVAAPVGLGGCGEPLCGSELDQEELARELVAQTLLYRSPGDEEGGEEEGEGESGSTLLDGLACDFYDLKAETRARINAQLASATVRPHGGVEAREALMTGGTLDEVVIIAHPQNEAAIVDFLKTRAEVSGAPRLVLARASYPIREREFAEDLATLIEWSFWGEHDATVVARRAHFMGAYQEQCVMNAIRGFLRTFVERSPLSETAIVLDRQVIDGETWELDALPEYFERLTSPSPEFVEPHFLTPLGYGYALVDARIDTDVGVPVHRVDFTLTVTAPCERQSTLT